MGYDRTAAVLTAFGAGVYAGWALRRALVRPAGTVQPPDGPEQRRIREEQAAFQKIQNYTVEDAYGLSDRERM